jgi:hypothetical protein
MKFIQKLQEIIHKTYGNHTQSYRIHTQPYRKSIQTARQNLGHHTKHI